MQDIYKSADDLDEDAKNIIKKCLGEDAYYKILYGSTITSDLVCLAGLVSELNAVPGSLDDLPSGRPGKAPETGGESGSKGTSNITKNLDTNNIPNMTKQEIIDTIPDNWKYTEHNGFVHIKDEAGKIRIRIDPPDKVTQYPHVHVYDNDGNLLDSLGNIVDRKSPDGHIPYKN